MPFSCSKARYLIVYSGTVGLVVILMRIKILSSDDSQNEKPKSLIEARLDRQTLFLAILWNLLGRQEDSITNKAEQLFTPSAKPPLPST